MPRNKKAEMHKERKNKENDLSIIVNNKGAQTPKEKRSRRFCLVTYIEPSKLEWFLRNSEWVQHWAYCTHDSDVKEDGTPKEVHTHVLLYTYDGKTASAIKKIFDRYSAEISPEGVEAQNTMSQVMHDSVYQWRYLIHKDDKNKYQYPQENRVCDDFGYWSKMERAEGMTDSQSNSGLAMITDMMNGASTMEMIERYGKEYIYHAKHFKGCLFDIATECDKTTFGGLLDMCRFALADSTYSENQLTLFFSMLSYVQAKFAENDGHFSYSVEKFLKS